MSPLFWIVWVSKITLTGWNTYRMCNGENAVLPICVISGTYFGILILATLFSWKGIPKPQELDALEGDYLRKLEEGIGFENKKEK